MAFDDERGAVAGAGLALVATLSKQLGAYTLASELIDLGAVPGHSKRRKVLTFVDTLRNFAIFFHRGGAERCTGLRSGLGHQSHIRCCCIYYASWRTLVRDRIFRAAEDRFESSIMRSNQWAPKTEHQIEPKTPRAG